MITHVHTFIFIKGPYMSPFKAFLGKILCPPLIYILATLYAHGVCWPTRPNNLDFKQIGQLAGVSWK